MPSISTIPMMLHMRVMTNNMAAVVNLLVFFLTVSVHDLLTLLNVGGVHYFLALLVLLFLGDLVALFVLLVMALWSRGVSMFASLSFSCTFVIPTISMRVMMNYMRVMSNNMRAVVNLSVFLLTVSVGDILTLLNVGDVYNMFTLIMFLMLGDLVALLVLLVITVRTTGVAMMGRVSLTLGRGDCTMHKTGGQEEN